MAKRCSKDQKKSNNGANLGFEQQLWQMADKLRGHMDAAEYKHVVLGLIFLKYISDAFQERYEALKKEPHADPEDRDEYTAENVFWVPKVARWPRLQDNAKQPTIGKLIDDAMVAIEKENPSLKGVLSKDYARPSLDKHRLGELIDLIGKIGLGDKESRSKDILGRVYEYFLGQFASAEGKKGGEFYTPRCVVKLLVEMIEPYKGRVYDPCCGSSGMFVQSEEFIQQHGGKLGDISIYGQESNPTTWRLAKMNLAIRGIEANIGPHNADTFHNDLHKDLKADFILANPPFNMSDWGGERLREDARWKYGAPPVGNANFAWVQHIISHLAPSGIAGFVLANGSMSSNQSGEGEIRKAIVEADLVDCMIALPGQLFYGTRFQPACGFLRVTKPTANSGTVANRRSSLMPASWGTWWIASTASSRLTRSPELPVPTHAWRGEKDAGKYKDIPGFSKTVTSEEIAANGHVFTPGRYVGAEEIQGGGEPFEGKMERLVKKLGLRVC